MKIAWKRREKKRKRNINYLKNYAILKTILIMISMKH